MPITESAGCQHLSCLFIIMANTLCFQNQRKYDLPTIPIEIGSPPQLLYPVLTLQSPYNTFLDNFANDGGTCDETTTPSCIGYSYTASDTSKTDETGIVKDRIVTRFGNHLTKGNLNIMTKESNKASNSYFSISPLFMENKLGIVGKCQIFRKL